MATAGLPPATHTCCIEPKQAGGARRGAHHGAWRVEKHTLRYSTALLSPLIRDMALSAATPTTPCHACHACHAIPCHDDDDDPIDS
jgi:hypothetical protein